MRNQFGTIGPASGETTTLRDPDFEIFLDNTQHAVAHTSMTNTLPAANDTPLVRAIVDPGYSAHVLQQMENLQKTMHFLQQYPCTFNPKALAQELYGHS